MHQGSRRTDREQLSTTAYLHGMIVQSVKLESVVRGLHRQQMPGPPIQQYSRMFVYNTCCRLVSSESRNVSLSDNCCGGKVKSFRGGGQTRCVERTHSPQNAAPPAMINTDLNTMSMTVPSIRRCCLPVQQQLHLTECCIIIVAASKSDLSHVSCSVQW